MSADQHVDVGQHAADGVAPQRSPHDPVIDGLRQQPHDVIGVRRSCEAADQMAAGGL